MESLSRRSLLANVTAILAASGAARAQQPPDWPSRTVPSTITYEHGEVQGRPLYVASHFRKIDAPLLDNFIEYISTTLVHLAETVPGPAWRKIAHVPIWLEYEDDLFRGSVYHPSRSWLTAHGYEPDKAGSVQLTKNTFLRRQSQPMVLMHELAHAYHHQVLTHDEPSILSAFQRAQASGKYDRVRRNNGKVGPAYALTNFKEFFAELTESYFGENDFEPYTRAEFQRFDPESYAAIEAAWNRP